DPDSDFAALINIWRGFEEKRQELGSNPLRTWCRKNFLNYLRLREWRDAHRQLTLIARELKLGVGRSVDGSGQPPHADKARRVEEGEASSTRPAGASVQPAPTTDTKVNVILRQQAEASEAAQKAKSYAAVHKAILAGLLSQVGNKTEEGDFLGARQRRFWVHPSSVIGRKKPNWLMAAELVETTKLFARMVAKIEPDWIEPLAGHLIKKNHFEPHWEKKRGQVVAYEQVTLYGMIVVGRRPVHYGPIDPPAARELFIREGLVRGEMHSRARALSANRELLERLDELEAKARRRDILADEETLFDYYDARLPADIYQTASFENWYKRESAKDSQLLIMREEDVLAREASEVTAAQYPDYLRIGELQLSLEYHFEPNHPRDGVTLRVPAPLLPQLRSERLDWLVPGLLETKAVAL
ncbi:MAG: ATP-dependent RNA helicase HrpA, partial [Gammaproteobacteria bacterium HGW-Gammaproteobacteria-7]